MTATDKYQLTTTKPPPGVTIDYQHPINRGLVGCLLFNEGAGSQVADISGNGSNGTITNVDLTSAWSGSPWGGGLILDGVDDHIVLTALRNPITTLTIEVRVMQLSNPSIYPMIVTSENAQDTELRFRDSLQQPEFLYNGAAGGTALSPDAIPLGQWVHCVGTASADTVSIYVDGVLKDSTANTDLQSHTNFELGRRLPAGPFYLTGVFDIVRIYNRAISAREVHERYSTPYSGLLA